MKICYVCCSEGFGGLENIVIQSLNELCKYFEVGIILPKNSAYKNRFDKKVSLHEYATINSRYNPLLYVKFYQVLNNYDLVHTHGAKATQIIHFLNIFIKKKFVATKHNARKGKIFNKVNNVISVSKAVENSIAHNSKLLYFGIKEVDIEPIKLSDKFTMISVGRLDRIKGYDALIKISSKLDFDFKLFIVGEGQEKQKLLDLIDELNLQEKVELLGFRDDTKQLLKSVNLHIISSRNEGLPLILLEGLFYSNLLLSTDVGGIAEVLDREYLANLDEFPNKILYFYNNFKMVSEKYKTFCNQHKNNFKFESYARELINYYKELI